MTVRSRRRSGAIIAVLLLANVLALIPSAHVASAQTAFVTPRYLRSIGGDGRPGVFAWGVAHNPVTNEIIVSDYLNFQMRRYDLQGRFLGNFWRPNHDGQPYSVAVDPVDGAIYVAELKDNPLTNTIVKYDKNGNFLYEWTPSGPGTQYQVWLTVDNARNLWALDSHYWHDTSLPPKAVMYTTNDATKRATRVTDFSIVPPGMTDETTPRLYGVDIAADNTMYVSDAWNGVVYHYALNGTLLNTFGAAPLGNDIRGVAVNDALGRVYVVDTDNNQIDLFGLDGSYQGSFGSEGSDPGEFDGGGRQITIDGGGNVWVADFGGFEVEKYDDDGTPLLTAPSPPMKPPVGQLAQPRDVAVDDLTGDVWVADAWAQRFQRFSSTGQSLGAWGSRGGGEPFKMNYPRTIAIDPVSRRIWIANERGHHLQVYEYPSGGAGTNPTYVTQIGEILVDDTTPGHFRWPVDVEFYTRGDGTRVAVIGDRMAASVKILNAQTFEEILMIPAPNHGTAIDPDTGNIYVADPWFDRVVVYDQAGTQLFTFGTPGTGDGQFRDPNDAVISNDVLYVVDEAIGRIQAFALDGTFLGKWGGSFDGGAYDFRNPVGIDADPQGRLYVTDSQNDRIQVFDPATARTSEIQQPGVPVVSSPAQQAVLPLGPVTLQGTASDNQSVANVELMIQHRESGNWWNSTNSTWQAVPSGTPPTVAAAWSAANAPATSVSWSHRFVGVSANSTYLVYVRTRDASGNVSDINVRTFGMPGTSPPAPPPAPSFDTIRPDGKLSFPVANQQLPFTPVSFVGTATDNIGVTQVRVALRDVATGRWWSGSGTSGFSTTFRYWDATVDAVGATSTGWSWSWTPRAPGNYRLQVQARDAEGNVDSSVPNVPFTITSAAPDTTAPETAISAPVEGSTVPAGSVSIQGTASDDTAIAAVRVGIQDTATSKWWNGTGWVDAPTTVASTLATPNAATSNWSYAFAAPQGSYAITATARDTSNNLDASPATRSFTASGAPDSTPPTTTVTAPAGGSTVARPVTISGTATDNVGVNVVRVAIRHNGTLQWWNGSGWSGSFTWVPATLASPGASSTGWSYVFDPPGATATYGLQVRSVDTSGNLGPNTTWRNFTAT